MKIDRTVLLFLTLLLLDAGYSFYQHFHMPLDGDLAPIILPTEWYRAVLEDPLGLGVLLEGRSYPGAGRFFTHWLIGAYFKTVPFWLQTFLSPLDSIYAACALIKTLVQLGLIGLLAAYIHIPRQRSRRGFLWAAVLVTPLFQTSGFYVIMGVVDRSVTYTFFYALPLALLLAFFLPFYRAFFQEEERPWPLIRHLLLLPVALILPLSGPLIPPVGLLICSGVMGYLWWSGFQRASAGATGDRFRTLLRQTPPVLVLYLGLFSLLCLYALYLGRYNVENITAAMPLGERYLRLGRGLYLQLTQKLGLPLLLGAIVANVVLLRRRRYGEHAQRLLCILRWVAFFSLIYLLLLPLGGYREYRPFIIRRDTMLPVLLVLMYAFGLTTLYLDRHLGKWYVTLVVAFLLLFTLVDTPQTDHYQCERKALETIARSSEKVVVLDAGCTIMSWVRTPDPPASAPNARLLHYWGVTREAKPYYQK